MRLLAMLLFISTSAQAQISDIIGGLFGGNSQQNAYTGVFQAPRGQRSMYNATQWKDANPGEYAACKSQYDGWFQDGVMEINLTIGYHDAPNNSTLDRTSFSAVRAILKRACTTATGPLCGFGWVANDLPDNITVMEKNIAGYNNGSPLKVRLTFGYSSASSDDRQNLGQDGVSSAQQLQFSANAEDQYFGSISGIGANGALRTRCEVCAYMGHARSGGGPDFRPVPYSWRDQENEPIYAKYLANRTTYRRLLQSLMVSAQQSRQLIAVMGCKSLSHFYGQRICPVEAPGCQPVSLGDFSATTGFFVSDLLSWPQNRDQYLGALLDGVTALKCRSSVDQNLATLHRLPREEAYQILGSFLGN